MDAEMDAATFGRGRLVRSISTPVHITQLPYTLLVFIFILCNLHYHSNFAEALFFTIVTRC